MLLGSNGGLKPVSELRMNKIWNSYLATKLRKMGLERPSQIGALYMADHITLRQLTEHTLPVIDDFPHRILPKNHDYKTEPDINLLLMSFNRRLQY